MIKTAPSSAFDALQENVREVSFISCILRLLLNSHFHVYLRPRPHDAGVIWKRKFRSEKYIKCFRPHYAGGIWKRNNNRSVWICVWGKLGQGNHVIIVMSSFSKSSVARPYNNKKPALSNSLWFEERFWKASFSERISVDCRPNLRNIALFSNSFSAV